MQHDVQSTTTALFSDVSGYWGNILHIEIWLASKVCSDASSVLLVSSSFGVHQPIALEPLSYSILPPTMSTPITTFAVKALW